MSEQAAKFWNEHHSDPEQQAHDNFLHHPLVQTYISMRAFGSMISQMDIVHYEVERRTKPGDRILSVGCGRADKERWFAKKLPDRQFVALDIADEIVAGAREQAAAEGVENLEIQIGDFNALDLPANDFDIALGLGAIHHVEALEKFWEALAHTLRPGGAVVAQEFIGAPRLQWTDAQIEHGDRVLRDIVSEEHKVHHSKIHRVPVEAMIAHDPSEAVRSDEILPTSKAAGFHLEGYCSGGCALLQPVLEYQVATYDPQNWDHNFELATLFREEDRLMRQGVLQDDFAMFVCLPPS